MKVNTKNYSKIVSVLLYDSLKRSLLQYSRHVASQIGIEGSSDPLSVTPGH